MDYNGSFGRREMFARGDGFRRENRERQNFY
jgi:hypothetical protein